MFVIINEWDGGKKVIINGSTYILRKGWRTQVKEAAKKYFKKYKFKIYNNNVFYLFISKKNEKNIDLFNEEIKEISKQVNKKLYYDVCFFN